MSSIPYSRYVFGPVPWYSFLIMIGAGLAVFLACRGEKSASLPKDTFIDLALWILPAGIVGARLYYVAFSWNQFRDDFLSVFRIWEGGLAIYGGVIAGCIVLLLFSRRRRLSPLLLCDLIVPGLALAQAIGRWGNWFNIEAYGLAVTRESLCFFPFAVQVPADGYSWHLAAFFYESVWDFSIFLFLVIARRKLLRDKGDAFFFYLLFYAAGRLVIEEIRMDSLYAASSVRISQLLSILLCVCVLIRYAVIAGRKGPLPRFSVFFTIPLSAAASASALLYSVFGSVFSAWSASRIILFLAFCSCSMILCLFSLYLPLSSVEVTHADDQI